MHWQDILIAVGQIIFVVALIPTVLGKNKPAFSTSLITAIVLFTFTYTYTTFPLWSAAIATGITGLMWFIIAMQTYPKRKHKQ